MKSMKRYMMNGKRRGSTNRVVRLGIVAMMVLMLAVAVMPVSPAGVSAKNNDEIVSSELVLKDSNSRLGDLKVRPTETPEGDYELIPLNVDDFVAVTVEPTLSDPIAYANVQINKLGCDGDYAGDYYDLAANCGPMNAPFTMSDGNGDEYYDGSFTDNSVVPGAISVTEDIPNGYGNPIVFCNSYAADGSESGFWQAEIVSGSLQTGIGSAEWLYCDWFNVPFELTIDGSDGSIYINKHLCPVDYDLTGAEYNDFAQDCNDTLNGVVFNLTLEDALVQSLTTGDVIDSAVNFEGLPPSAYSVTEELPGGYGTPVVYCSSYVTGDEAPADTFQVEFSNGGATADLDLSEVQFIFCDWYNVPTTDGSVEIHKWECPEGLEFDLEPTIDELLEACTETMNDVTFELTYPDNEAAVGQIGKTGDAGDGAVLFTGVDAGNIAISEEIPAGYGDPMVYCRWGAIYDEDGEGGNPAVAVDGLVPMQTLPDGVFNHEMLPNEGMLCDWFNFPSDDTDIIIHKWECPESFEDVYNALHEELLEQCTEAMEGIDFTLTANDGGEDAELGLVENTDADGNATFENVVPGPYVLTEAMPTGYGTPIVFCYEVEGEGVLYEVTEGGMIEIQVAGSRIVCDWFNIPTDDGSITIYKYTCPAGYDLYGPGADPKNDCVLKTNGINFGFSSPSYPEITISTGDSFDGGWTVGSLDPETYTVSEYLPDGTIGTYVTCQWLDENGPFIWNSIQPYNPDGAGLGYQIDLDLYEKTSIVCQWYNVPEKYEGGELIIIKYWCDGNIYNETHCELYGGGVQFGIDEANADFDTIYVTTGWDGTASVNLFEGSYDVWETDYEWCKAESDQVNGNGEIEILDGETSYLTVFNCGPGKEKEPPVKKFPNTGAGTLAMSSDASFSGTTLLIVVAGSMMIVAFGGIALRTRTQEERAQA